MFRCAFHTCAHIYNLVLLQNLSQTPSLNSNLVCTFHLIVQFFLPICFLVLFVQHTCLEYQMICFVAGGAGNFMAVAVAVAGGAGYSVAGGTESFGVYPWLILQITISVLFFMLFFIFANGAMQSP